MCAIAVCSTFLLVELDLLLVPQWNELNTGLRQLLRRLSLLVFVSEFVSWIGLVQDLLSKTSQYIW